MSQRLLAAQPVALPDSQTLVYRRLADGPLRLHLIRPESPPPAGGFACVLWFFGGAWQRGSVRQFEGQARRLAERGVASALVDYRVRGRQGSPAEAALADARAALAWLQGQASVLGLDARRLLLAGGSAGAYLALATALEREAVAGLLLFNPVLVPAHLPGAAATPAFAPRLPLASLLPGLRASLAPTLILHGEADSQAPFADVQAWQAASTALGNRCELLGYPGQEHGFFNPGREQGRFYRATLQAVEAFLDSLGLLR
ncbi:MAG: Carboxylesterase NlhH [Pseudomonas citronellolis]|nr:MAG: Carboxylesterase NlhH [Pseudomonas citronellolis]